ncbi:hypothetical protein RB213_013920 [Colletotrichum asianum]
MIVGNLIYRQRMEIYFRISCMVERRADVISTVPTVSVSSKSAN